MSYRKTTSILWGTNGFFPVTLSSPDLRWMHPNTPDFLVSFLVSQLLINQMLVLIGNIFSLIWKMIERDLAWASPSVLPKKPVWQKSYFQISIISSSQICSFRKKNPNKNPQKQYFCNTSSNQQKCYKTATWRAFKVKNCLPILIHCVLLAFSQVWHNRTLTDKVCKHAKCRITSGLPHCATRCIKKLHCKVD